MWSNRHQVCSAASRLDMRLPLACYSMIDWSMRQTDCITPGSAVLAQVLLHICGCAAELLCT